MVRVATFHKNTMKSFGEFIGACGFSKPSEITPDAFHTRIEHGKNVSFREMYFPNSTNITSELEKELI